MIIILFMALRRNFAYSFALTLSTYLVPLLVFPYISRVLGPVGIGTVDTVESVINYAIMFSMMGLTTIGIREIAVSSDNKEHLRRAFSNLFVLNLITTLVVIFILLILIFCVPEMREYKTLFFVGIIKLLFNLFWIEWFFKGIENFKYITIRSITLRVLFIISVFCFVREEDDYTIYYILWVSITVGNALCNWIYKKKYTSLSFSGLNLKSYVRPFFLLGLFAVFSSIYTQLNVSFLGFLCDKEQVGFYTTATRLYSVIIALFTALTAVMIPRMSVLIQKKDMDSILKLNKKVFQLLFMFGFPVVIFLEFFAEEFICLFAGCGFEGAVLPMRIVIPLIFVIGTEQIFIMQILVPLGKDKHVFLCAVLGALTCVVMNLILVKTYMAVGSAISWFMAECVVLAIASCFVKKFMNIIFPYKMFLRGLAYSIVYGVIGFLLIEMTDNSFIRIIIAFCAFAIYTFILEEYVVKMGIVRSIVSKLSSKSRE